ncbi:hypothetical protein PENCOP_c003G07126 [Penicillium coprophilum]|uniref:HNH nuclease domain-containing protein n=1 Tax=Penicillium coprophilum TaxID=36646 RepID=A0A1V6UY42_9EURO|nr:hypothetical protein PENCOP_c003G07126 [Penicillium coprophilum]
MSTLNQPAETPILPERISSLMAPSRQSALRTHRQRFVSAASRLSEMSVESTTSDIFDVKLAAMESELEYMRCVRDDLNEASQNGKVSHDALQREIQHFLKSFRSSLSTIQILKAQRPLIFKDIDEEVFVKRQRTEGLADQSLLEHAYRDAIISRVLGASAKQKGPKFDQSAFKRKVYAYYGVNEHCHPGFGWCHEVSHLFGVSDGVLGDPRNGITLADNIELLFNQGTITIVPMPGPMKSPNEWRCVVLDESKKEDIISALGGSYIRLKEIDNKPLTFVSDSRPRRRYLYFCFIIAYIHAESREVSDAVAKKVEATPRCVSGSELPDSLVQDKTFDSSDTSTCDTDAGSVLGADVRDAILAMKSL